MSSTTPSTSNPSTSPSSPIAQTGDTARARDVVVIGAGLAGLACARSLSAHGHDVVVLEASERAGGRMTTDVVDGFLVDRGFQVLNPAYRHVRRLGLDDELRMRPFPRAVRVRTDHGLQELVDPTRRPAALGRDLSTGLVGWSDLAVIPGLRRTGIRDLPRGEFFDRAGFTTPLRRQVVDPFLAGVVGETDQSSSARFTAWLGAMFMAGTPGLPTGGMRRLPELMSQGLEIWYQQPVQEVSDRFDGGLLGVVTETATLRARHVVVAAGPVASAQLLGLPAPVVHPTSTFWFGCDQAPSDSAAIHVDGGSSSTGDPAGPVVTTSVVSHAAPDYAPQGRHLVAALTLDADADEGAVRAHGAHIYGVDTEGWEVVACHRIPVSLPHVAPGAFPGPGVGFHEGLVVTGDQFGNASIEGALASGERAASTVMSRLG